MPVPDTLQDLALQEISEISLAIATTTTAQTTAGDGLRTQQSARADAASHLAQENDLLAADRAQLALIPMPGDGDPLLVDFETRIANLRKYSAAAFDADRVGSDAQIDLELNTNALARLQALLAGATALRDDANQRHDQRTVWESVIDANVDPASPASAQLAAVATAYKAAVGGDYLLAKARVEGDLGGDATLLTFLRARLTAEVTAVTTICSGDVTTAQGNIATDEHDHNGLEGDARGKRYAYDNAWTRLRWLATGALRDLDQAKAVMSAILATPALSPGELARIAARKADASTASADLSTAPNQAKFDSWKVAVPDAAWQRFLAFEEASRVLDKLIATTDAVIRVNADGILLGLDAAERDLAHALYAAHGERLSGATLADRLDRAQRRSVKMIAARGADLLAALRGDRTH